MANDVTILSGFLIFFLILAVAAPVIEEEFGQDVTNFGVEEIDTYEEPVQAWYDTSFATILVNIGTILFWTFGIPWWINLTFLLTIRLLTLFLIYRAIRSGGG